MTIGNPAASLHNELTLLQWATSMDEDDLAHGTISAYVSLAKTALGTRLEGTRAQPANAAAAAPTNLTVAAPASRPAAPAGVFGIMAAHATGLQQQCAEDEKMKELSEAQILRLMA